MRVINPIKIDKSILHNHSYLEETDHCFFFMEYTARKSFEYSPANQIIKNLKKPVDTKETSPYEWKYKQQEIINISNIFKNSLVPRINPALYTFVPIPPSKCKSDPLYDDRIFKILNNTFPNNSGDVRDLIEFVESKDYTHHTGVRDPELLKANMSLNKSQLNHLKVNIILVDDVITSGAHFKACKEFILEKCPTVKLIQGVFIARTIYAP